MHVIRVGEIDCEEESWLNGRGVRERKEKER